MEDSMVSMKGRLAELAVLQRETGNKSAKIKGILRSSGRLPDKKYAVYMNTLDKCRETLLNIEKERLGIFASIRQRGQKKEKTNWDIQREAKKRKRKAIFDELNRLTIEYHQFAADSTRVASMRQMAAEFANKLKLIVDSPEKYLDIDETIGDNQS